MEIKTTRKIKILNKVDDNVLKKMIELDCMVFRKEDRGTLKVCRKWLKCNPDIYTVLMYDDEVVGYINFMPITPEAYRKIYNGQLKDYDLQTKHVLKFSSKEPLNCLFTSIVIKPEYQDTNAVIELWNGFLENIKQKQLKIGKVVVDCVSQDGEKFVKRNFKAEYITNSVDGRIYESSFMSMYSVE